MLKHLLNKKCAVNSCRSTGKDTEKKLLKVASVHNYGAFIRIPGSRSQGLIHRTQVSKVPVEDVSDILQRGDKVWCKVINITDDNKIALSMKVVDQGNGKDLDPNGVQIHQDEQRRKAYVPGAKKKTIQLEAVFNTTCSKCGTHGHLAIDCFKSPDGKKYELIPENDLVTESQLSPVTTLQEKDVKIKKQKKKRKHKKQKEERKGRRHKQKKQKRSSSSSSDVTSESSEDEHKKCKTHKRKRRCSVSPSSKRKR